MTTKNYKEHLPLFKALINASIAKLNLQMHQEFDEKKENYKKEIESLKEVDFTNKESNRKLMQKLIKDAIAEIDLEMQQVSKAEKEYYKSQIDQLKEII